MQMQSHVADHCRHDAGSNHCEKSEEEILEKLECEKRDAFIHEHLKKMQDLFSNLSKITLILDEKGDCLKKKGWKFSP